jgi:hypothetical protein
MVKMVKLNYFTVAVCKETKALLIECRPDGVEFGHEYSNHYLAKIDVIYLERDMEPNFALMRTMQNTTVEFSWHPVTGDQWKLIIIEKIHSNGDGTREIGMLVPTSRVNEVFDILEALK